VLRRFESVIAYQSPPGDLPAAICCASVAGMAAVRPNEDQLRRDMRLGHEPYQGLLYTGNKSQLWDTLNLLFKGSAHC